MQSREVQKGGQEREEERQELGAWGKKGLGAEAGGWQGLGHV